MLELTSDNHFVDIVAESFDAGIRLDSDVSEEMIAVRISEPLKMVTVASPKYLAKNGIPQNLDHLSQHQCIGYIPEDLVVNELASAQIIRLFDEYAFALPALYLYYPHRNVSPALRVVINSLKV
ncbi:hypothetical protein L5B76_08700 [Avibacterium sp. 21-594]|nr:hypothetical protein [Avibacterium sp. 21-594]